MSSDELDYQIFTARRYVSAVYICARPYVCSSVRLSQAGTVPEWLKIASHKQRRTIPLGF